MCLFLLVCTCVCVTFTNKRVRDGNQTTLVVSYVNCFTCSRKIYTHMPFLTSGPVNEKKSIPEKYEYRNLSKMGLQIFKNLNEFWQYYD